MCPTDETLRGRIVIAADRRAIGEVAVFFLERDAMVGGVPPFKPSKESLTGSALPGACSTLGH